jgi:hypothetical protein
LSSVLVNGKHVTVTTSGEVKWNPDPKAIDLIVQRSIAMIKRRTTEGQDIHGQAFKAYSPEYAKAKQEAGRGTNVNLTVTQTLLRSVAERTRAILMDRAEIVIGPGTGAHPVYSLGDGKVHRAGGMTVGESRVIEASKDLGRSNAKGGNKDDRRIAKEARAMVKARREARASKAAPTNAIGAWLHKTRPWLGLSPKEVDALGRLIRRLAPHLFRSQRRIEGRGPGL